MKKKLRKKLTTSVTLRLGAGLQRTAKLPSPVLVPFFGALGSASASSGKGRSRASGGDCLGSDCRGG